MRVIIDLTEEHNYLINCINKKRWEFRKSNSKLLDFLSFRVMSILSGLIKELLKGDFKEILGELSDIIYSLVSADVDYEEEEMEWLINTFHHDVVSQIEKIYNKLVSLDIPLLVAFNYSELDNIQYTITSIDSRGRKLVLIEEFLI